MTAKTFNPLEIWSSPAKATFEFWASLWPTAPLFGLEWRFADTVAQWSPVTGKPAQAKPVAPKTAAPTVAARKAAKPKAAKPEAVVIEAAPVAEVTLETAPASAPNTAPETAPAEAAPAESARTGEPAVPASLLVKAPAQADDLTVIKGVGPALARQLNGLGVYKISQIAGFSDEDLAWIDMNLPAPRGRCFRDGWSAQAKALLA